MRYFPEGFREIGAYFPEIFGWNPIICVQNFGTLWQPLLGFELFFYILWSRSNWASYSVFVQSKNTTLTFSLSIVNNITFTTGIFICLVQLKYGMTSDHYHHKVPSPENHNMELVWGNWWQYSCCQSQSQLQLQLDWVSSIITLPVVRPNRPDQKSIKIAICSKTCFVKLVTLVELNLNGKWTPIGASGNLNNIVIKLRNS